MLNLNLNFIVFVFILSHGQNQVDYGFTINDDLLVENLKAESICAQRIVYGYIKASGKGVYELTIDNTLVVSCKTSHSKYTNPKNYIIQIIQKIVESK